MTTSHIVLGKPVCSFIHCPEKAAGAPHYHYFTLGTVKTVVAAGPALK